MAQNDSVDRLQELGFEIISITRDVLVCKLDPKDPKSDNGRWIDLSIDEERCRALHRAVRLSFLRLKALRTQHHDER